MKVLYLLMLIAGLLWIGDFSITLKPFSISLPCWYKSVGILLFWLSMTIYVLGEHTKDYKEGFDTGIKQCIEILDRNCHSKEINNDEQYRINKTTTFVEDNRSENREKYLLPDYKVQVKFAGIWITVKSFHDEDEEYAKNCANELLEKLNEKI